MKLAIVIFVVWWALVVCIAMRLQTMRRGTARVVDNRVTYYDLDGDAFSDENCNVIAANTADRNGTNKCTPNS